MLNSLTRHTTVNKGEKKQKKRVELHWLSLIFFFSVYKKQFNVRSKAECFLESETEYTTKSN